ncbi:PPE domain-containing protein [Nocardia carnea]|uniref:PPE domain-containing protein n=1 Tax=Nocardia carnea TaxID=37328 RepID=UPI002457AA43|nr:hypothetical protein [Nocardia carnea]
MDPDYAPTVEVFDNLTHEQIHAGVSLLDPSALQTGGQLWQGAATGLNDAVTQAHTEIRGAISDGWRGSAAGLAGAAVRDFEAAGRQLADVLATVGQRLGQAGDAAETLRTGIGEPSGVRPDLPAALLDPHAATGNIAAQQAAESERADAVRVMESVYLGAFIPTGSQVPAFPDLPGSGPGAPDAPTSATSSAVTATDVSSPVGKVVSYASDTVSAPPRAPGAPGAPQATADDPATYGTPALPGAPAVPAAAAPPAPADQPQATTAAGTQQPGPASVTTAPAVAGGSTPVAPASTPGAPVFAVPVRPAGAGSGSDSERDREEQQRNSSGDAITGMGAGAIGGMMGGAMAADAVRSNSPVAPVRTERDADEDDDLHFGGEELTFLEEAAPGGQLIGTLEPTTPPVLGEWTESE